MREKRVGAYTSYVVESNDVVAIMGEVASHAELLETAGFVREEATGEYIGKGAHLYAIPADAFFTLFSGRDTGTPQLTAQVTDGERFFQIDALPLVAEDEVGSRIEEIYALDLDTRAFIAEGISKFRVG